MIAALPHPHSKTARFCAAIACIELGSIFVGVIIVAYVWGTLTITPFIRALSNSSAWWLSAAAPALLSVGYVIFPNPKPRPLPVAASAMVWLALIAVVAPLSFPEPLTLVNYTVRTVPLVVIGVIGAFVLRKMYANPWQT